MLPIEYLTGLTVFILFSSGLFSMLGLGGGQLYVPILYWLGLNLKTAAIPTALLLTAVTQLSSTTTFARKNMIAYHTAVPLIITTVLITPLGTYLSTFIADWIILAVFAFLLLLVSAKMFTAWRPVTRNYSRNKQILIGLVTGVIIGLEVGILGRGGGATIVPVLLLMGLEPRQAAATSAFCVTFSASFGFVSHAALFSIHWGIIVPLAVAAVIGSQIGSRLVVNRLKPGIIRKIFAVVLGVVGIAMILQLVISWS